MDHPNNVKSIFLAAAEKPAAERAAFLEQAVGNDSALRARVEALLRAHDNPDSFLNEPAAEFGATIDLSPAEHPLAERPGTLIGPYKLLEQIGEGGMGVVYMADQQAPVRRRVALKIIKAGMDTRQVIARFEAERQALALMDHSNIARVLDAGATESGRPYFVMELVRGIPITEYCDQNNLPVHERLELFVQVCHAVQHAHQKGIIHRDLKPSNILVTLNDGRAVPKVIDFGVAKAMGQQLTEKTLFTAFAQMVGTPLYMSPEQAEMMSVDIDTRSDIYSLGVLLYELLTGTTPYDQERMRSAAFDEIRRIIREEEPPKPSTRISTLGKSCTATAAHRQVDAHRLGRLMEGDLDWIVMKALEKDRTRRYDTAGNFAADVLRHLSDQPVEACPPSAGYRFHKFAQRNRIALTTAVLVSGALILGTAVSTWQAIRATRSAQLTEAARVAEGEQRIEAERQRKQAESNAKKAQVESAKSQQVAQFLTDMLEGAGPGVARGRDATLLREILDKTAERVDEDLKDQPEVQGDLWFTLGNTYGDIGDRTRAIVLLEHAVESYRVALGNDNTKLALGLGSLGLNQSISGNFAAGRTNAQLGLDIARKCADPKILATCLYCRAFSGRPHAGGVASEDVPLLREAVAILRQLGNKPDDLAACLDWLGFALGGTEEAESVSREALALGKEHLPSDHPNNAAHLHNLASVLLRRDKFEEAETLQRESVELHRKLYDLTNAETIKSRRHLARILAYRGKWDEAEALIREGMEAEALSPIDQYYHEYGIMLVRLKASRGQLQESLDESARLIEAYPLDITLKFNRAVVLLQTAQHDDYRKLCHELLLINPDAYEPIKVITARLAMLLPVESADFVRACQWADSGAVSKEMEGFGNGFTNLARVAKSLAEYRRGHFKSAIEWAKLTASQDRVESYHAAQVRIIQAMASAARQQTDSAAEALAIAEELIHQPHVDFNSNGGGGFGEWAIVELLRREAAEIMNGGSPITRQDTPSQITRAPDSTTAELCVQGDSHAAAERWNESAAIFSRVVEIDPNNEIASLKLAIALLKTGDEDEYRRHCQAYLDRTADSLNHASADRAAKSALLLPVDDTDFSRACALADFAATATEPSDLLPWMHLGKSLAEFRRTRFDSANKWADRCLSADNVALECQAAALFIQGAACARLEQMDAARATLAKGDELAKRPRPNIAQSWLDWTIADILRGEAEELLARKQAKMRTLEIPTERPSSAPQP